MKKIICFLLSLILIVGSCSKKEEAIIIPPCAVTKLMITDSFAGMENVQTYTYGYDASLRLIKSTLVSNIGGNISTSVLAYQYLNGLVVTATVDGGSPLSWTNENGHVVKIFFISGDQNPVTSTTLLTYDGQGRVLTNNYTNDLGVGIRVSYSATYGSDGNLQKSTRTVFNGSTNTGDFTTTYAAFDGKNSPYTLLAKGINQPYFLLSAYGEPNDLYFSKSNPVSATEGSTPVIYTYEYNDASYPTKVVAKHATYTMTYLFEYQKCK
ncbi:MAG: hypothetical protein WDN75_05690 [Bacteroidota bacterium]